MRLGLASRDERIQRVESVVVVMAQAARVVEPDVLQQRALLADLEQLVDLLLVLDHRMRDLGVVERKGEFGRYRILVERHRNRAQRLRCQHAGVEPRPVLADHHQVLARLQPGLVQAMRQRTHELGQLLPAQALPDAVLLLAHGCCAGALAGMHHQELGEGTRHRAVSCRGNSSRFLCRCADTRRDFDIHLSFQRQFTGLPREHLPGEPPNLPHKHG